MSETTRQTNALATSLAWSPAADLNLVSTVFQAVEAMALALKGQIDSWAGWYFFPIPSVLRMPFGTLYPLQTDVRCD